MLGRSADICVYLFAFISGFGLFYSYKDKPITDVLLLTLTKIIRFLLCYWLVIFVIFLPFYAVNQGSDFQFVELLKTMFGFHGFFSYGWYVYFYLLLLLTLPLFRYLLHWNKWVAIAVSYAPFIGAYLILNRVQANVPFYDNICNLLFAYAAASIGYTIAKHGFLSLIWNLFRQKRWPVLLVSGIVGFVPQLIVFGYFGKGVIQPFAVVPIIVFLIALFNLRVPSFIGKPLDVLGHNSMNMWYIHYIFFCPYIIVYIHSDQWILLSKVGIVAIIIGTLIALVLALPFTWVDDRLIAKITIARKAPTAEPNEQ